MTDVVSYSTLKTAIGEWMFDRTDLTSFVDAFIDNAEARMNFGTGTDAAFPSDPIRTRAMITSSSLTLTSGTVALPSDFIEPVRVTAETTVRRVLEYASPDWLDQIYPDTTSADPSFYTILGANLIVRPTTSSNIELQYYAKIAALSDAAPTNWLILASPNVHLYASLIEANIFIGNTDRARQMYALYMGAAGGLMRTDMRSTATMPSRRSSGAVA